MTHEEKQLLLRDLCARLPYGIRAQVEGHINPLQIRGISKLHKGTWAWRKGTYVVSFWNDTKSIEEVRPYLRPMSSMTEEEKEALLDISSLTSSIELSKELGDLLLSHHLDFRGLIPKGLALVALDGMYKTE